MITIKNINWIIRAISLTIVAEVRVFYPSIIPANYVIAKGISHPRQNVSVRII